MTGEKIELRAHEVDINPQYADSMEIETFTMHLSFETVTEADEGGLGTSSGRGEWWGPSVCSAGEVYLRGYAVLSFCRMKLLGTGWLSVRYNSGFGQVGDARNWEPVASSKAIQPADCTTHATVDCFRL
jgi:hypothetical protein